MVRSIVFSAVSNFNKIPVVGNLYNDSIIFRKLVLQRLTLSHIKKYKVTQTQKHLDFSGGGYNSITFFYKTIRRRFL